jgi:hypothetical protein
LRNAVHGSDSDENAAIEGVPFCWKRAVLTYLKSCVSVTEMYKIPFYNRDFFTPFI